MRESLAFLVFGMSVTPIPAVAGAQDETETTPPDQPTPETQEPAAEESPPAASPPPKKVNLAPQRAPEVKEDAKSEVTTGHLGGWKTEIHGYFRAPMTLGISSRPNPQEINRLDPNDPSGQARLKDGRNHPQISYGPNRVMDWSYYSFAYTGLQEQDWAELFIHEKKEHVNVVIGWMGYWYGSAGYRNPDAAWWPGMAYATLDTDFEIAGIKPNAALTMGAFWPQFGYVEKYDTFSLGRFRMLGEQVTLTVPFNEDLTLKVFQGFGTNRDGSYNFTMNANPLYAGKTGVDLITFGHVQLSYQNLMQLGLHYNYEITRDPRLTAEASANDGKAFKDAAAAKVSVAGAEINLRLPYVGRLWLSPSYIKVVNGWALAGAGGIEVMHAQNGYGLAENYLAWTGSPKDSTGSGSLLNFGFLYENSLHTLVPDIDFPEIKVSVFGLATKTTFDLPEVKEGTPVIITQPGLTQIKYGMDMTVQVKKWLAAMVRWDTIRYNHNPSLRLDDLARSRGLTVDEYKDTEDYKGSDKFKSLNERTFGGYVFSALTARLSLYSHYLSGESIFLQFSRYFYGDNMVLAGTWPWNTSMVAGATVIQAQGYSGKKPDENVIKLQVQARF